MCHNIFDLHFFSWFKPIWAPDKQAKVFSNSVSILPRYSITKFEKFDSAVCMTPGVKIVGLANPKKFLKIFSFMINVFTSKRISPYCPFKSNYSTDSQRFQFWLHSVQFESVVWCTPQSLTLRRDAHAELFETYWLLDSAVGCTMHSLTYPWDAHCGVRLVWICPFFVFVFLTTLFFQKTSEVKKDSVYNLWLTILFSY